MDVIMQSIATEQTIYGLRSPSSDRAQARDIPRLSRKLYATLGTRDVLPFYVVSSGYDPAAGTFSLFIGGAEPRAAGLDSMRLPAGPYACITVRPKLGMFWGAAIGEAKRFLYTKWLPDAPYEAADLTFELHDAHSVGRHPTITVWFALREKATA